MRNKYLMEIIFHKLQVVVLKLTQSQNSLIPWKYENHKLLFIEAFKSYNLIKIDT